VTHSLLGLAAFALLLAGTFRIVSRRMRLAVTLPLGLGIAGCHVFLDLVTSYGTQLLAPFSDRRFTLDAVFIIDPFFTGSLLVFVLLARLARERGVLFAAAGLLWLFAYPLTNLGVHDAVQAAAFRQARAADPAATAEVLPAPFAPVYWKVITANRTAYRATTVNVLAPGREYDEVVLPKADPGLMRRLGRQSEIIETFAWFARFPYVVEESDGQARRLRIGDVRFHPVSPIMRAVMDGPPKKFTLAAVLDRDGELVRCRYRGRTFAPSNASRPRPEGRP
jgi:inner membrane protein